MLKRLLAAALAACSLAFAAPSAFADEPFFDCYYFFDVRSGGAVMVGYVVHPGGGPVSITCTVEVNGAPVESWTASGDTAAWFARPTSVFTAASDHVDICAQATTWHGAYRVCKDVVGVQLVVDPGPFVAPLLCPVLVLLRDLLPPLPGVYEIRNDGDLYVLGLHTFDCPPFET